MGRVLSCAHECIWLHVVRAVSHAEVLLRVVSSDTFVVVCTAAFLLGMSLPIFGWLAA